MENSAQSSAVIFKIVYPSPLNGWGKGRRHTQLAACNAMVSISIVMEWEAKRDHRIWGVGTRVLSTLINKQTMSAAGPSLTLDKRRNDNWMTVSFTSTFYPWLARTGHCCLISFRVELRHAPVQSQHCPQASAFSATFSQYQDLRNLCSLCICF